MINLAKNLQQHFGIKSGDVISICSENRIEFGLTIYAAFLIGATVAPLNNTYTEREYFGVFKFKMIPNCCAIFRRNQPCY